MYHYYDDKYTNQLLILIFRNIDRSNNYFSDCEYFVSFNSFGDCIKFQKLPIFKKEKTNDGN